MNIADFTLGPEIRQHTIAIFREWTRPSVEGTTRKGRGNIYKHWRKRRRGCSGGRLYNITVAASRSTWRWKNYSGGNFHAVKVVASKATCATPPQWPHQRWWWRGATSEGGQPWPSWPWGTLWRRTIWFSRWSNRQPRNRSGNQGIVEHDTVQKYVKTNTAI